MWGARLLLLLELVLEDCELVRELLDADLVWRLACVGGGNNYQRGAAVSGGKVGHMARGVVHDALAFPSGDRSSREGENERLMVDCT